VELEAIVTTLDSLVRPTDLTLSGKAHLFTQPIALLNMTTHNGKHSRVSTGLSKISKNESEVVFLYLKLLPIFLDSILDLFTLLIVLILLLNSFVYQGLGFSFFLFNALHLSLQTREGSPPAV
jgi:hypothetical protein